MAPLPSEEKVCGAVPELAGLPVSEGVAVYRRIRGRVWRCGAYWRGMVWPGVVVMVGMPLVGTLWIWVFVVSSPPMSLVGLLTWFLLVRVMVVGLKPLMDRAWRRGLGWLARVELGMVCRGCGYDLRATEDEWGPRLGRCPECGRVVEAGLDTSGKRDG